MSWVELNYLGYRVSAKFENKKIRDALQRELHPFVQINSIEDAPEGITIVAVNENFNVPNSDPSVIKVDHWNQGYLWTDNHYRIIKLLYSEIIYEVDLVRKLIKVHSANLDSLIDGIIRAIKLAYIHQLEMDGWLCLHGSSVTMNNGEALLFLGDSGSGKSTLALESLTRLKAPSLISCDMVMLKLHNNELKIAGFPTPFNFLLGTIACYPELYHFFPPHATNLSFDQLWEVGEKEHLEISTVAESLGVPIQVQADYGSLVFPTFTRTTSSISSVDDVKDISNNLMNFLMGSKYYFDWSGVFEKIPGEEIIKRIGDIAKFMESKGDVYRLYWTPNLADLLCNIPLLSNQHLKRSKLLARK